VSQETVEDTTSQFVTNGVEAIVALLVAHVAVDVVGVFVPELESVGAGIVRPAGGSVLI
jgi:hypothetical protein